MKKTLVLVGCALLIAPTAFSQVYSANAVGYVKKTIAPGALDLLRYDFLAIDGATTTVVEVLPADNTPANTRVFLWDAAGQQFSIETLVSDKTGTAWSPGTSEITPGVGFFVQIDAAEAADVDLVMVGEVPGDNNNSAASSVAIVEGLSLVGYAYPASVAWTDTTLAGAAVDGDRLFTWDTASQQYNIDTYVVDKTGSAWSPGDKVLEPGQGFFYQREIGGGALSWDETKPYAWP